ncbi:MAG TPA: deoxyribodipyrimidine photo-lyase [bacterium]|nr:deoxyribodipyrimidine photo-lyase [bacterium]
MNPARVTVLKEGAQTTGPVLYWMSRDQRVADNWALSYAQSLALSAGSPLFVVFCLSPNFLGAAARQYEFMLAGLAQLESRLRRLNIAFKVLAGNPAEEIVRFAKRIKPGAIVSDFDPLRIKMEWRFEAAARLKIPFLEVDAHNIIPCRAVSGKLEYGAYTIRPKIKKRIGDFLDDLPPAVKKHPGEYPGEKNPPDWRRLLKSLGAAPSIPAVKEIVPGEKAARAALSSFLDQGLSKYDEARNDPNEDAQSGLSPYLHFGQISAQRVAVETVRRGDAAAAAAFLEELIVRRELADNFCLYNPFYDSPRGFPAWARETLNDHLKDAREYIYTTEEFEGARTHDELWNAAQAGMVAAGRMHGYMRMYWGKKILEWSETPEQAMRTAIYLNDKYELDGRDPNGYAGIAWCVGGVHDRPWPERKVFGKIRFMNWKGCASKFDVEKYIAGLTPGRARGG